MARVVTSFSASLVADFHSSLSLSLSLFLSFSLTHTHIQCEDGLSPYVIHALKNSFLSLMKEAPQEIKLKRFTTQGYIGLFLEDEAASWFREIMKLFAVECRQQGELY